jgi:hypothetical protein
MTTQPIQKSEQGPMRAVVRYGENYSLSQRRAEDMIGVLDARGFSPTSVRTSHNFSMHSGISELFFAERYDETKVRDAIHSACPDICHEDVRFDYDREKWLTRNIWIYQFSQNTPKSPN